MSRRGHGSPRCIISQIEMQITRGPSAEMWQWRRQCVLDGHKSRSPKKKRKLLGCLPGALCLRRLPNLCIRRETATHTCIRAPAGIHTYTPGTDEWRRSREYRDVSSARLLPPSIIISREIKHAKHSGYYLDRHLSVERSSCIGVPFVRIKASRLYRTHISWYLLIILIGFYR